MARFVAKYFYEVLSNLNDFKYHRYEQALMHTFIKFDELLKIELVNNILNNMLDTKDNEESQLGFLKFCNVKIKNEASINNCDLNLSEISESSHNTHYKDLATNLNLKPSFLHKGLKYKHGSYSENEDIMRTNQLSIKDTIGEQLIYSFGGVILEESNQKIKENLVSYCSGTTANIVLLLRNHIYIANAGDSLAVMYKNRKAIKLNSEHKLNILSERNRVIKAGKKLINYRIEGKINVSRAIGI